MEETREIDIDLSKIAYMLRTKIVFILLITIFCGAAAGAFTHFFIEPTYTATVKFYVQNSSDTVSTSSLIDKSELDAAEKLVNFCIYVIKADTVLDKVAEDTELSSGNKLSSMITATAIENTMAFQVTVRSKDAALSAKIANSIAKIAPDEIVRIVKGGGVSVIDYAKKPTKPSSPSLKKNTLVGAFAGFFISFAAFFIYELFNTTITNTKDLERVFDIPILGTVPRLDSVETSTATSRNSSLDSIDIPEPASALSSTVLENIQSMKGDAKNDVKK